MENADLLTNASILLEKYREELPGLEARCDFLREAIAALTAGTRTRRGRPPQGKPALVEDAPTITEPDLVA